MRICVTILSTNLFFQTTQNVIFVYLAFLISKSTFGQQIWQKWDESNWSQSLSLMRFGQIFIQPVTFGWHPLFEVNSIFWLFSNKKMVLRFTKTYLLVVQENGSFKDLFKFKVLVLKLCTWCSLEFDFQLKHMKNSKNDLSFKTRKKDQSLSAQTFDKIIII